MHSQFRIAFIKCIFLILIAYNNSTQVEFLQEQVWGVAYEIEDENSTVWNQLDFREKNGYKRKICTFYPKNETLQPFDLVVYIGDPENNWYAGEASIKEIAKNIIHCKGMSGFNLDYLWQLAQAMRNIAPHADDPHLFELEKETLHLVSTKIKEQES